MAKDKKGTQVPTQDVPVNEINKGAINVGDHSGIVSDTTAAEPVEEFVSENLTKLRATESELEDKLDTVGNKSPEGKKIRLQLWEVSQSIENEIAAIKKAKIAAENEAKQKKVVSDFMAIFTLYNDMKAAEASFEALPIEARDLPENEGVKKVYTDLSTSFKNATEPIINRLLGSVPRSTTAATAGSTGSKGGKIKEEILELIAPLYATMSPAQVRAFIIKDKGYNDGTANATIHQYECENSLNGKTPDMLKK